MRYMFERYNGACCVICAAVYAMIERQSGRASSSAMMLMSRMAEEVRCARGIKPEFCRNRLPSTRLRSAQRWRREG